MKRIDVAVVLVLVAVAAALTVVWQAGPMAYSDEVLADSPIQYFRLNEAASATTLADSSGNGDDATLAGTPNWSWQSGSLLSDGDSSLERTASGGGTAVTISCGTHLAVDSAFSVEAWVNLDDLTSKFHSIVSKGTPGGAASVRDFELRVLDDDTIQVILTDGASSTLLTLNPATTLSINTNYHVVFTWDGTTNANGAKLYLNGSLIGQGTVSGTPGSSRTVYLTGFGTTSFWLDGNIDEVAFYQSELSSSRVSAHYSAATASDSISVSTPVQYQTLQRDGSSEADIVITGTYSGSPTAIEASFNGGDYATIDASPSGGSFSGTLSAQAAGTGTLTVRWTNDTGVSDTVANFRIGDVFLWIGQSNQDGRFTNSQAFSGGVGCSIYDEDDAWINLASGYQAPGQSTYSVLPLLASHIVGETGVPCAFICETEGATGLVSPDANWASGGARYTAAMTAVSASGINGCKLILWYQGERDAVNDIETAAYAAAESAMLDAMQAAQSALSGVKMVSANIGEGSTATSDQISAIQQAKIANWNNDDDILPGPTAHDQEFSDGLHWKTDAQAVILAGRWWRCIKAAAFSGTEDPRGPRLASATYVDDTITLTLTGGETPIANGTDTTGWIVADGNGSRTVSSVSISTRTVTITCDQTLADTVTVSYADGSGAVGTTTVDGGSIKPMPIEPFVDETVNLYSPPTATKSSLSLAVTLSL